MIRAIALDFDGVIVESADIKTEAFRALFAHRPAHVEAIVAHHMENEGISRYRKFRHIQEDILHEPYDERTERDLDERFSGLVKDAIVAAPSVPGAPEMLEGLATEVPLYVVSGTPDAELETIVADRGLARYFKAVLGSSKTKAERLREVMTAEHIAGDELLFVGDATTDWRAAREVGTLFVGRVRADAASPFPQEGVTALVDDMTGLARLLAAGGPLEVAASAPPGEREAR